MTEKDKKKLSFKERTGKTRVGTFLEGIVGASPAILEVAGLITGVDGLNVLADRIRANGGGPNNGLGMSDFQVEVALKELELDIQESQEITKRWEADMKSEHWLPQLIRPLVVANFTLLIDIVVLSSMWGQPLGEAYLPLLVTMGVTAIGGYFTVREVGKTNIIKHK